MLALRLHADGELSLAEEPVPIPGTGEALIRVTAVGLCGSDRHWMVEQAIGDAVLGDPLILGHEFAGFVETGRYAGRRVAVDPADPCGSCELCRSGNSNLCQAMRFAGHGQTDGALRQWLAWPEACLYLVSERVADPVAALVEPLAVALHGLDLGHLRPAESVAVIGSGPIGVLLVALARRAGASVVVATDPLRHRLELAAAFGATATVEVSPSGGQAGALLEASGDRGFDLVLEAAGGDDAVEAAIEVARPGSRVILVGIPSDDRMTITASVARRKGLTLKFARRSTPDTFRRAVDLADSGELDLGRLVSRRVSLENAGEALPGFIARDGMKVVIEPTAG
jgi:L-iditol 2-dehydrogenase